MNRLNQLFHPRKKLLLLGFLTFLVMLPLTRTYSQTFSQNHRLYQIQTQYFTIIFPEASGNSAMTLAAMADDVYAEVADLLNVPMNLHLDVVITPDSQELNGYFTPYPSNRIVLYEAPILPNSGFALFNDTLYKLFLHELTHAVSLTIRSPFWNFLSLVVGDFVAPALFTAPGNFIEGVAILFESLDGYGRAHDTDYLSIIQQDIIENRFMTFHETASIRSPYPFGAWYIYGAGFSRYLHETYGIQAYAQIWKEFGSGRPMKDILFIQGAFERAFGVNFDSAWEGFRRWISIQTPVVTDVRPLTTELDLVQGITARDNFVYYGGIDGLHQFDVTTRTSRQLVPMDTSLNRIDISPDGTQLLLSVSQTGNRGLPQRVLKLYDLEKQGYLDRNLAAGLAEAAFVPQGIVAVRVRGYTTDLILLENGTEQILFSGTPTQVPSFPGSFQDNWIHFLLQNEGTHYLARVHIHSREVQILQTSEPVNGIRNLNIQRGHVVFSYDNDHTLFKLGHLTREGMSIQTTPLSGGVRFPALVNYRGTQNPDIVYVGAFSRGHTLMEFPWNNDAIHFKQVDTRWIPFNPGPPPATVQQEFSPRKYYPITGILLPQLRLPRLYLDEFAQTPTDLIRGAGFMTYASDPTETLSLETDAAYIWNPGFVDFGIGFTTAAFPFDLSLGLSDRLYLANELFPQTERQLIPSLSLSGVHWFFPQHRRFQWSITTRAIFPAAGLPETNPYSWDFQKPVLPVRASMGYSQFSGGVFPPYNLRGFGITLGWEGFGDFSGESPEIVSYIRGNLDLAIPIIGMRSEIRGYQVLHPALGFHPLGTLLGGSISPGLTEPQQAYSSYGWYSGDVSPYFLKSDTSAGFRFDISTPVPGNVYVRHGWIRAGYRNALVNADYLDSVYVRTGYTFYLGHLGTLERIPFTLGIELEQTFRDPVANAVFYRIIFE